MVHWSINSSHASPDASASLDHQIHVLQQADVLQNVTADSDDVRIFTGRDCADVPVLLHHQRWPVGGAADRLHRGNVHLAHPDVEFVPGGLAVEVHRNAAVG